jgi:hypothetical protein
VQDALHVGAVKASLLAPQRLFEHAEVVGRHAFG